MLPMLLLLLMLPLLSPPALALLRPAHKRVTKAGLSWELREAVRLQESRPQRPVTVGTTKR